MGSLEHKLHLKSWSYHVQGNQLGLLVSFQPLAAEGLRIVKWSHDLLCNVVSDSGEANCPGKDWL